MSKGSILVVDDESEIREGLELLLSGEGYGVSSADTGESGLGNLEERPFDLLLLDVSLPDRNGIDLLREIRTRDPHLPIVLITAYGSIDMARAAFKNGAMDYITKPWSNDELLAQVAQAVESRRLRDENVQLKLALKQRFNFPNIIGKSEKMLTLLDLVAQVAPIDSERSEMRMLMCMNYGAEFSDQELRAFQDNVAEQDRLIVESQRPELLPLDLQAELHLRSDRMAIAYRKWLRSIGLRYGTA